MSFLNINLITTTLLTPVETVDNSLVTNVYHRTTSLKDVYTCVDKTVDNLVSCGLGFFVSQETGQLLIGLWSITELYTGLSTEEIIFRLP